MELILIPGFWLDGSSWGPIVADLEAAGHTVHALTMPGKESIDADRSAITLRDHVKAVVEAIDESAGEVVLIGHSGGGAIAWAAADARVDAVSRIIYVDSGPLGAGDNVNDGLPAVNGEVPLPDWSVFDDDSLVDMTDAIREHFRAIALPEPAHVTSDPQELHDERRYAVPSTVITCEMSEAVVRDLLAQGHPYFAELGRVRDYDIVELTTGHWPQFTKPTELTAIIVDVLRR